ncbi:uncharacterized protein LOC129572172 isoform X2 [Sitodiplosis mosellana]|uniref:uncharacterized protein LOC129572172 isoform X2 n=1 Tax=Sitodiplosis mosellana TaxID=263140 RepID=UPI002443A5E3|nr:uncharacterized protein LOC129572172 isoform X2 [Sitodiplosis mosellana]
MKKCKITVKMASIVKMEPNNFDEDYLCDSYLHVLKVKPDPDVFFTHVLQYAIEIGGQNSIPLFAMSSIGAYRVWYKTVLDQLPDDYRRPLYRGIVQRNITMEEIRLLRKEVERALLQLNALVRKFNKGWGKDVTLARRTLESSMVASERKFGYFDANSAVQPTWNSQRFKVDMVDITREDTVCLAIISSFDTVTVNLLFELFTTVPNVTASTSN